MKENQTWTASDVDWLIYLHTTVNKFDIMFACFHG